MVSQAQYVNQDIIEGFQFLRLPTENVLVIIKELPIPKNGGDYLADYLYADYTEKNGVAYRKAPLLTPIAQSCHTLRVYQKESSFKHTTIKFIHDDVSKTNKFLSELSPSERNAIGGIHITYPADNPVNYKAFEKLCQIMNGMCRLGHPHLFIPTQIPLKSRQLPIPGLCNALAWYKEGFMMQFKYDMSILRSLAWSHDEHTAWIQDLIQVKPGLLVDFDIDTVPRIYRYDFRSGLGI